MTEPPRDPRLPAGYYYMVPIEPPKPPRRVPVWAIVGFTVTALITVIMVVSVFVD